MSITNCLGKVVNEKKKFVVNLEGSGCLHKSKCGLYKFTTKRNKIVIFQQYETGNRLLNRNRSYKTLTKREFFNFFINQNIGFKPTCSLDIKCCYYFFIIKGVEFINDTLIFKLSVCNLSNKKCSNNLQKNIPIGKINYHMTIDNAQPIFDFKIIQSFTGDIEVNYNMDDNLIPGQASLDGPIVTLNNGNPLIIQPNENDPTQRFYISWQGQSNNYYNSHYFYKVCNQSSKWSIMFGVSLIPNTTYILNANGKSIQFITFDDEYPCANLICRELLINGVEQIPSDGGMIGSNFTDGQILYKEFLFKAIFYDGIYGGSYYWQIVSLPQTLLAGMDVSLTISKSVNITNLSAVYAKTNKCVQSTIYTPSAYNPFYPASDYTLNQRIQIAQEDIMVLRTIFEIKDRIINIYNQQKEYNRYLNQGDTPQVAKQNSGFTTSESDELNAEQQTVSENFSGSQTDGWNAVTEEAALADENYEWGGEVIEVLSDEVAGELVDTAIEIACECLEFLLV